MRRQYTRRPRRKISRRKKIYRKKRMIRAKKNIYYFSRYGTGNPITLQSLTETSIAMNFSLIDVPNYTEFTNLYDMYKIKAVKVYFYPAMTESTNTSTAGAPVGETRCITAIDRNDSSPTTFDALRQYQNAKVFQVNRRHARYIYKPMIFDTSGYSISPWVATTSPSTNYFGLKFAANATAQSTGTYVYNVEIKYYLAFRNVN